MSHSNFIQTEPKKKNPQRGRNASAIILFILGWVALLWATDLALLSAMQIGMIGLGLLISARVIQAWQSRG